MFSKELLMATMDAQLFIQDDEDALYDWHADMHDMIRTMYRMDLISDDEYSDLFSVLDDRFNEHRSRLRNVARL